MADDDDVVDDPQQHQLWASQANVEDIDFTAPGAQARISSWHTYLSGPPLIKNVLKGDQFKHMTKLKNVKRLKDTVKKVMSGGGPTHHHSAH